ncbi:hypothetical protein [Treponema putidum]|uniref:Uncharacterized protein n=1 Tax=Treponema putidum TaxID=221027 RepID=A0ABY5HUL6_9SPIR|nr:hypothetical protein [Treponema putidum]AIN93980.1 hypothetical protein JO40_07560 [Treponema putidum]UTY27913.1 hypothetical protein E4N76_02140 [Treponema putidum]UTY30361.1 hypothetical protein E4N75_01465 [Treponema putidum]
MKKGGAIGESNNQRSFEVKELLSEKVPFLPYSFWIDESQSVGRSYYFFAKLSEAQRFAFLAVY